MHEQSVPWTEGTLACGGTEDSVRRQTGETNNSRVAAGSMRSKEHPSRVHATCRIFFRTTGPIWTKLGTKHPWVTGIEVCLHKGPCIFSKGSNYEIGKFENLRNRLVNST